MRLATPRVWPLTTACCHHVATVRTLERWNPSPLAATLAARTTARHRPVVVCLGTPSTWLTAVEASVEAIGGEPVTLRLRLLTLTTPRPPARARTAAERHGRRHAAYVVCPLAPRTAQASILPPELLGTVDEWVQKIRALRRHEPDATILLIASVAGHRTLVEAAFRAGLTDVLDPDECADPRLVQARLRRALDVITPPPFDRVAPTAEVLAIRIADRPPELRHAMDRALGGGETWDIGLSRGLTAVTADYQSEDGRIDDRRIASCLGLSLRQLATALPVSHQALGARPLSTKAQPALRAMAVALRLVDEARPGAEGAAWLRSPHEGLDGATSTMMLLGGHPNSLPTALAHRGDA